MCTYPAKDVYISRKGIVQIPRRNSITPAQAELLCLMASWHAKQVFQVAGVVNPNVFPAFQELIHVGACILTAKFVDQSSRKAVWIVSNHIWRAYHEGQRWGEGCLHEVQQLIAIIALRSPIEVGKSHDVVGVYIVNKAVYQFAKSANYCVMQQVSKAQEFK